LDHSHTLSLSLSFFRSRSLFVCVIEMEDLEYNTQSAELDSLRQTLELVTRERDGARGTLTVIFLSVIVILITKLAFIRQLLLH
jgi:hypothetical protein